MMAKKPTVGWQLSLYRGDARARPPCHERRTRASPLRHPRRADRGDFAKTIYIRGEAHSVVKAILRNLLHATHHIGQIDLLATAASAS
ncbi:MAG: DUF1572 family protein [Caldilineaceae bacterium]